jgi:hypothetical protein
LIGYQITLRGYRLCHNFVLLPQSLSLHFLIALFAISRPHARTMAHEFRAPTSIDRTW